MIVAGFKQSRAAVLWTALFLASLAFVAVLGSSLGATQALVPVEDVTVAKSVNVASILPGETPYPRYTITFTNDNPDDVILDVISDTLPAGFEFAFMAFGTDVEDAPADDVEPEVAWQGPITVPAESTLVLVYAVKVPGTVQLSATPRVNSVEAIAEDGTPLGPATASIIVGQEGLALDKTAEPLQVNNGGAVTFTVTLANNGQMTSTVETITDTLDPSLTFGGVLLSGDITAPPQPAGDSLVWTGPFTVAPQAALTLVYSATTPEGTQRLHLANQVDIASSDGPRQDSVSIEVRPPRVYVHLPLVTRNFQFARLVVTKSVAPTAVPAGGDNIVTYSVAVVNGGMTTGTVERIEDTLPPGFTFVEMVSSGEVTSAPNGTTGTIVWQGMWSVPPGGQVDAIYRVRANPAAGLYTNRVLVGARNATVPSAPAQATLVVEQPIAGLTASNDGPTMKGQPTNLSANVTAGSNVVYTWAFGDNSSGAGKTVSHVYPDVGSYTATVTAQNGVSQATATTLVEITPAVLLQEDFNDTNVRMSRWTPFLNYWRLEPGQWRWEERDGINNSGAATQDCWLGGKKVAEDALLMYLGEGSSEWTNYRVETRLLLRGGVDEVDGNLIVIPEGGYPVGLWVRGQYQDVGDTDTAGWVTGYYIIVSGKPDRETMGVRLSQLQTLTDCWDQACNNPQNLYDFNNPHALVDVKLEKTFGRYSWYTLAVEVRGANIKVFWEGQQVIDFTDTEEPFLKGTVGLKTYKSKTASFDNIVVTPLND